MHYEVSVKVEDKTKEWLSLNKDQIQNGLDRMAWVAVANARMTVPRKVGNLALSGHTESGNLESKAIFGNTKIRYAAVQELGSRKGIPFKHYTTPGTGPHYLKKAGDAVAKKGIKSYL